MIKIMHGYITNRILSAKERLPRGLFMFLPDWAMPGDETTYIVTKVIHRQETQRSGEIVFCHQIDMVRGHHQLLVKDSDIEVLSSEEMANYIGDNFFRGCDEAKSIIKEAGEIPPNQDKNKIEQIKKLLEE